MGDKFYITLDGSVSVMIPDYIRNGGTVLVKQQTKNEANELTDNWEMKRVVIQPKDRLFHNRNEMYQSEVKQLFEGSAFGELALISEKPRAATIKCLTNCTFATMSKKNYLKTLARIDKKQQEQLIEFF